jgi:hypothetical protein
MTIAGFMRAITILAPVAASVGVLVGLSKLKRLSTPCHLLFIYLVFCLTTELLSRYLGLVSHAKNNLFMFPVFALGEFIIFSLLYLKYLMDLKKFVLYIVLTVGCLLILTDIFFLSNVLDIKHFNCLAAVVSNLTIMVICLLYIFKGLENKGIRDREFIWFTPYITGYFSLTLLIFLSMNFLVNERLTIVIYFWVGNLMLNVSFYLLIAYFLWKHGRTPELSPSGLQ